MQAEIIKLVSMSPELLKKEKKLVRCWDCKHGDNCINTPIGDAVLCNKGKVNDRVLLQPDWFCADGEAAGGS